MQATNTFEAVQPKETNNHGDGCTTSNTFGSGLDLLKEGQTEKNSGQIQPAGEKSSSAYMPDLRLDMRFPGDGGRWYTPPRHVRDTVQSWEKHWEVEAHKLGHKVERGFEKLNPQDFLKVAEDIVDISIKFGPTISKDVLDVIKGKGLDPKADAKLCSDLIALAKSPEARKLSEDARKVLDETQARLKLVH